MKNNMAVWGLFFALSSSFASADAATTVEQVLGAYTTIQVALVEDDLPKAHEGAKSLHSLAFRWIGENPEHAQLESLKKAALGASALTDSEDLDDARIAFVKISQGVIAVVRADESLKAKWQLFYCPMVSHNQGYWVQPKGQELANPFMGGSMPGCGSKKPW